MNQTQLVVQGIQNIAPFASGDWIGKRTYTLISGALCCTGVISFSLAGASYAFQQKQVEIPSWLMSAGMGILGLITFVGGYTVWYFISRKSDSGLQLAELVTNAQLHNQNLERIRNICSDTFQSLSKDLELNKESTQSLKQSLEQLQTLNAKLDRELKGGRDDPHHLSSQENPGQGAGYLDEEVDAFAFRNLEAPALENSKPQKQSIWQKLTSLLKMS
jgi:hypothetical protein